MCRQAYFRDINAYFASVFFDYDIKYKWDVWEFYIKDNKMRFDVCLLSAEKG